MGSQIDPRLYGHNLPGHGTLHHPSQLAPHPQQQQQQQQQQQHQQNHHHPQHQQLPQHHLSQFTPPQPVRLPHIHQVHDLAPRIPQQSYQQQQPFYGVPRPHPPQFSSPSAPIPSLPPAQDHASGLGPDPRHDQYQDDIGSPSQGMNGDPNDPKRSRACEACRGLKVRCDQEDPSLPCKRCAKAKRNCVVTAPSRKRQKKTDSRVAELEKKIDALTASLNAKKDGGNERDDGNASDDDGQSAATFSPKASKRTSPELVRRESVVTKKEVERKMSVVAPPTIQRNGETVVAGIKRRRSEPRDGDAPPHPRLLSNVNSTDGEGQSSNTAAIDSQVDEIIERKVAAKIFDRYVTQMAQHLPVVVFDPGTTAAEVRLTRPILFLAILVAAAKGHTDMELQEQLNHLLLDIFADSIVRNGAKTLELVQALLISTIWYRPPRRYDQMNFYQLSHISAVMAIDIGLGKRMKKTWRTMGPAFSDGRTPRSMLLTDTVEVRRTWLGCYFQCSNTALSLRRPNLIRWTNYMDECIEMLESSSEALPSDKLLCQHIKLQHINEDVCVSFSMDDPSATVTMTDSKVQYALRGFERNLSDWTKAVPKSIYNTALEYSAHTTGLYMHEVVLHINHNVDDFRAPFTEESLKAASGQSDVLSPAHSAALSECLTAVHGIFNGFFAFDLDTVRALPIFYFVRVAYAVVVLIKLHFAITAPKSEIGKIINKDDLTVEAHLGKLLDIFHMIAKEDAFRPASKFLIILEKLREWFEKNKDARPLQYHSREPSRWSAQYDSPSELGQAGGQSQVRDEKEMALLQPLAPMSQMPQQAQPQQQSRSRANNMQQSQQHQQHPQHQQMQQLQPQMPQYPTNPPTPLHFLSEVASTHSPHQSTMTQQQQQQAPTSWYTMQQQQQQQQQHSQQQHHSQMQQQSNQPPPGMDPNGMDLSMGGMEYMSGMGGFEQAMDMTLGPGGVEGDISSFFMGSFGLGMGMDGLEPDMYGMGW